MIPYRALCSNIQFGALALPEINNQSNVVSMLPSAHMYGLMFELLYEMSVGAHVHFLTRIPSPKIILQAMEEVKPDVIIAVPLIIEKVYKSKLQKIVERGGMKILLRMPVIDKMIQKRIRTELISAFGGKFIEIIIGGAAFNKDIEKFFWSIDFPYTVGYGMTECAPIITYAPSSKKKLYSCGTAAVNMKIRVVSPDPSRIEGEVQVYGPNLTLGYYKNEEATRELFTEDGWLKTGDMGIIDEDGYLFLRGRYKCMILSSNGQNIYPEEIESVINAVSYVVDSLVIEDGGGLTVLIYPTTTYGAMNVPPQPEQSLTACFRNQGSPNSPKSGRWNFSGRLRRTPKRVSNVTFNSELNGKFDQRYLEMAEIGPGALRLREHPRRREQGESKALCAACRGKRHYEGGESGNSSQNATLYVTASLYGMGLIIKRDRVITRTNTGFRTGRLALKRESRLKG